MTLEQIAVQHPIVGGRAVFTARVMLDTLIDDPIIESSARLGNIWEGENSMEDYPTEGSTFISKIFPNPNNGKMQLDYKLQNSEEGILKIIDLSGKIAREFKLTSEFNSLFISEDLRQGIYLYQVIVNENVILMDKLVIIE